MQYIFRLRIRPSRLLVDNKDVSRFTRTLTENGKTTTIDGERVIAAAMRYYLVSSESLQTQGLSQEEAFEKAYEKTIRVMAGDDALFNTNDVDTSELESAIEDLKATIEISEDVAKLATEQAKQLEGEVNGQEEQTVRGNEGESGGASAESVGSEILETESYANESSEDDEYINFARRSDEVDSERGNNVGGTNVRFSLSDAIGRSFLNDLTTNGFVKSPAGDGTKYSLGYTDNNGKRIDTAKLVSKNEYTDSDKQRIEFVNNIAPNSTIVLFDGYLILNGKQRFNKDGKELKNGGCTFKADDGSCFIFVSRDKSQNIPHEGTHAVTYNVLNRFEKPSGSVQKGFLKSAFTNGANRLGAIVDIAFGSAERVEDIYNYLVEEHGYDFSAPDTGIYHFYDEAFAYLNSSITKITDEERNRFYNALLGSDIQEFVTLAKESLKLRTNKYGINESLYYEY